MLKPHFLEELKAQLLAQMGIAPPFPTDSEAVVDSRVEDVSGDVDVPGEHCLGRVTPVRFS